MASMVLEHPGVLVGGGEGAVRWGVTVPGHRWGLGITACAGSFLGE